MDAKQFLEMWPNYPTISSILRSIRSSSSPRFAKHFVALHEKSPLFSFVQIRRKTKKEPNIYYAEGDSLLVPKEEIIPYLKNFLDELRKFGIPE